MSFCCNVPSYLYISLIKHVFIGDFAKTRNTVNHKSLVKLQFLVKYRIITADLLLYLTKNINKNSGLAKIIKFLFFSVKL